MRFSFIINILFIFLLGCADLAENPTDSEHIGSVPDAVLAIIDGNCANCHQPVSPKVFKGQKPFFRKLQPDSSTTLDTLQIWQSRDRIRIRVSEGTMPRVSDTSYVVFKLPQDQIDLIINWAD